MDCRGPAGSQGLYPPAWPSRRARCHHPGFLGKPYPACARPPHRSRRNYSPGDGRGKEDEEASCPQAGRGTRGQGGTGPRAPHLSEGGKEGKSPLCLLLLPGGRGAAYRRGSPPQGKGRPAEAGGEPAAGRR